jgi:hypothetical protein
MIGESSTETTARAAVKGNARGETLSLCFAALSRHGETHFLSKEISFLKASLRSATGLSGCEDIEVHSHEDRTQRFGRSTLAAALPANGGETRPLQAEQPPNEMIKELNGQTEEEENNQEEGD